jgi:hypothetical protein
VLRWRFEPGVSNVATNKTKKVEVENVNHPGQVKLVDGAMYAYAAMRQAFLKVLPRTSPGLTVEKIHDGVTSHLPEELFPRGAKAGWWAQTVQLDLEAKGVIVREKTRPLRLHKA